MQKKKRRGRFCGALAAIVCHAAFAQAPATDAGSPWLDDLATLEAGLARSYANFEYTLRERRIDLPMIDSAARAALAAARDDAARRAALDTVVAAFRDPHLRIDWQARDSGTPPPACPADLRAKQDGGGVRFDRLDGYTALDAETARDYRAALYRRPGASVRYGVVRIGVFMEAAFGRVCADAARAIGVAPDAPCDDTCATKLEPALGARLNASLADTLDRLHAAGAQQIVVDVTDNSGGSDWVEAVARILGGPLRAARVGMLRHPAWRGHLDEKLQEIDTRIAQVPANDRTALAALRTAVAADRAALGTDCDLASAWTDRELAVGRKAPPCSTLVMGSLYSAGFAAGTELEAASRQSVTQRYGAYRERKPTVRLVVLINENTHSSAELFAAVLQDSGRATVVGTPSAGAGCGQFTRTGTAFSLPRSGATVRTPDCVRLRADGSNERRGIVPDVIVPWAPSDSAYQRAEKLSAALNAPTPRRRPY